MLFNPATTPIESKLLPLLDLSITNHLLFVSFSMIQDKTISLLPTDPENPMRRAGKPSEREASVWADTRVRPEKKRIAAKKLLKGTACISFIQGAVCGTPQYTKRSAKSQVPDYK